MKKIFCLGALFLLIGPYYSASYAQTLPDLVVSSVVLDTRCAPAGGSISYAYTRQNIGGEGPVGNSTWDNMGYLSTNQSYDAGDIALSSTYSVSSYHLSVGWSNRYPSTGFASASIPGTVPVGIYYLIFRTDIGGPPNYYPGVVESNENNNWGVSSTTLGVGYSAPAAVSLVSPAAGATGVATAVTLDWGDLSGAISYDVQVCADSGCSSVVRAANVATSQWVVSPALSNNTLYYWRARANNICGGGTWSGIRQFTTVGTADFAVTSISLSPSEPLTNSTFNATVTVQNQGNLSGNGGWLDLWLNQASSVACGGVGNAYQSVGTLAAGESKTFTFSNLSAGTAGSKTLRAFVDSGCSAAESNEGNNQGTLSYTVGTPDFVVASISINPAVPLPGANFNATVAVKNQGTIPGNAGFLDVWLNRASSPNCGSAGNSRQSVGTLAAGQTKEITFANLTAGDAGYKVFQAFVDSACSAPETNEGNNQKLFEYQVSADCLYSLDPAVWSFGSDGGMGGFSVTTGTSCDWSPASDSPWLVPQGGGMGPGVVNYSVLPNVAGVERIGKITVRDQAITIMQAKSEFTDVCTVPWAYPYIYAIYAGGITSGYGDGVYGCGDVVTREQMAVFLIRALDQVPADGYCGTTSPFSDVGFDRWSCKYIKKLAELGVTSGYGDGRFGPTDSVTREQMAIFILRGVNQVPADGYCGTTSPFSDVAYDRWSCKYVKMLSELGITTGYGDGRFGPEDQVTRAQMAVFLAKAFLEMQPPALPQPDYCPPLGSVLINEGATLTQTESVSLTLSASDPTGVVQMCVSNTPSCSSWEPYVATKAWILLPGDGPKTVYIWYKDGDGDTNPTPYLASINLSIQTDLSPPTGSFLINGGAASTQTVSVTLTLSASDPSGVAQMCISNTNSCSAWEAYAGSKVWILLPGEGTQTVYVWFMDGFGNINPAPYSDSIDLISQGDTTPPIGLVFINGGAASTDNEIVTLTFAASDPSGVAQMCVSDTPSCSSWELYTATKIWRLPSGTGSKTVYVWFMDGAGNMNSTPYSDSIELTGGGGGGGST